MKFWLFPNSIQEAVAAQESGCEALFIDWETHGKETRQSGFDTSLKTLSMSETLAMRNSTKVEMVVRINSYNAHSTPDDIAKAIDVGADRILLAFAQEIQEVEKFLSLLNGRLPAGIMIESESLLMSLEDVGRLPWSFGYIGLNDLMISRGGKHLWGALRDGTVKHIMQTLDEKTIGFGGLTRVDGGAPMPFRLLGAKQAELDCKFAVLRRSFHQDVELDNWGIELQKIRHFFNDLALQDLMFFEEANKEFEAICDILERS